jgi:aspartyl/asparaginyl beta-hydroxylase (cupin superfamily)
MEKYPAIWQTDTLVNSAKLLHEFEEALKLQLHQVYDKNKDWTGVTVLRGSKVDHLASLPFLVEFLEQFGRENVLGVTYFNLAPHSVLHRHRDMNGNLLFGIMRLHIPLKTNPKAMMEVQKKKYHMSIDTLWALDTSGLHALENGGDHNRIHLVVDIKYGDATAKYFPAFSLPVILHVTTFVFIVLGKILRDMVTNPSSLLARASSLFERIYRK